MLPVHGEVACDFLHTYIYCIRKCNNYCVVLYIQCAVIFLQDESESIYIHNII